MLTQGGVVRLNIRSQRRIASHPYRETHLRPMRPRSREGADVGRFERCTRDVRALAGGDQRGPHDPATGRGKRQTQGACCIRVPESAYEYTATDCAVDRSASAGLAGRPAKTGLASDPPAKPPRHHRAPLDEREHQRAVDAAYRRAPPATVPGGRCGLGEADNDKGDEERTASQPKAHEAMISKQKVPVYNEPKTRRRGSE